MDDENLPLGLQFVHAGDHKHATKHFHDSKHAMIRSFEPGEDWGWCYVDQQFFDPTDTFGIKTLHHP